jgi:predicted ester cyclase
MKASVSASTGSVLGALAALLAGSATQAGGRGDQPRGGKTKNEQEMDRFIEEVLNQQRFDRVPEFTAPNFVDHYGPKAYPQNHEGVQQRFEAFGKAFTYVRSDRPIVFAHDSYLVQIATAHFKHTGDWMGLAPTNKDVKIGGVEVYHFDDGQITERWGIWDVINAAIDLGAMLTPVPHDTGMMARAASERRVALG